MNQDKYQERRMEIRSINRLIPCSQSGLIMPYAVIALVILSILGLMMAQNSMTESTIAGNIKAMKINFYSAEGTAIEAARALENEIDQNLREMKLVLPNTSQITITRDIHISPSNVAKSLINPDNSLPHYNTLLSNSGFQILARGTAEGESLDVGTTERITYKYQIFGASDAGGKGRKIIEVGYKREISLIE